MARLSGLIDVLELLVHLKCGIGYFLKKGASVTSFSAAYLIKEYVGSFNTIIDVGANIGQFTIAINKFFPSAMIYSFEPVPEVFQKLNQNTKRIQNLYLYNLALGSRDGEIKFYLNKYSLASSPLIVSEYQIKNFRKTALYREIIVPVKRLDSFNTKYMLNRPVLLKLDVQGYEKEVLCGAKGLLKTVDYLMFEVSFIQMYKGELLFEEMLYFVNSLGFHLLAPVGLLKGKNGQIVQMDLLFQNNNIK